MQSFFGTHLVQPSEQYCIRRKFKIKMKTSNTNTFLNATRIFQPSILSTISFFIKRVRFGIHKTLLYFTLQTLIPPHHTKS